jgi:pimeloyl-ACP methyl ester carboxylesterase
VQHGASRNGAEYCEAWVPAAERHGFLVVAIAFPKESWPDAVTYNNGHVLAEDGTLRPREGWSQAIPGRVFALLREAGVTRRDKAYLWGHSAGGQFVHRLLTTQPHGIFEAVGAANSGWYTLPTLDVPYPDGLGGIGLTRADVERFLGYPLVIFSGDRDIDGTTENFPKHESAMAQGPNRFARAQFYLAQGQAEAERLGVPCRWTRVVVPGVAHEGMKMSALRGAILVRRRRSALSREADPPLRTAFESDNGRSALHPGTALHAPKPPFRTSPAGSRSARERTFAPGSCTY